MSDLPVVGWVRCRRAAPRDPTLPGRLILREGLVVKPYAPLVAMLCCTSAGCETARNAAAILSGKKVKTVHLEIGNPVVTDATSGMSHVRVECNIGLVIDADWRRNAANEFGYDIFEPSVNQDSNRLAVMMTARGIIAAYSAASTTDAKTPLALAERPRGVRGSAAGRPRRRRLQAV